MLGGLIASVAGALSAATLLAARELLFRSAAPRHYRCALMKEFVQQGAIKAEDDDEEDWRQAGPVRREDEHSVIH